MSYRRKLFFRFLAILLGLSPLIAVEAVCRIVDWGRPQNSVDPLVGFSEVRPLFVHDPSTETFTIPRSRQTFFRPESFAARKAPNEFRVFCLGGSTVQGRPYAIETSFTTWLELSLQAADPTKQWEVVNCGGVSYASYRLAPILSEVVAYAPDLILVYTGHNEFLEDRSYSHLRTLPQWQRMALDWATQCRTFSLLSQALSRTHYDKWLSSRPVLTAEVAALLDNRGGLEAYKLDDEWRQSVIQHYEINLRRMVRIANEAGIPIVLMNPVSNLRDTPPFKCENQPSLEDGERRQFATNWGQAKETPYDDALAKTEAVQSCLRIDPRYADAYFLLGRCFEASGDYPSAKQAYERAKDEDLCPLRMPESMHARLESVCAETETPLLDVKIEFEQRSPHKIVGDDQLIDHVHPRIRGHQQIAAMILQHMTRCGMVTAAGNWESARDVLYRKHLDALPPGYFPMGVERLRGLKMWASGRAERTDVAAETPN